MKKLLLLVAAALLVFAGCAKEEPVYKVGTASVTTVSGRAAAETPAGRIQANVTYATVVMDKDGKFVSVDIDTAQNEGTFDLTGAIVKAEARPTKKERGADYGMKNASQVAKAEWDEQIKSLEDWMVGKTLAEVLAMPLAENKPSGDDLKTSVTITVDGYIAAVKKAAEAAVELKGVAKVGSGSVTSVAPRAATADAAGRVQVNTTYAGVALDKDGKVLWTFIDVAQNQGTFLTDGTIDKAEAAPTKKEKGDAYGMKARSEIGKEWYEQAQALEAYFTGKTIAEIKAIPTFERDATHLHVPSGDDLKTSVTITIESYQAAVEAAAGNARDIK